MKRTLGRSNIQVSALGFGCWAIGGPFWQGEQPLGWGEVDDNESINAIHAALNAGVTFFDTADVYGAGHSERILGKALAGKRDKVIIATKFGNTFDETSKQLTGQNADPAYIRQACEASLKRLNTDYIDLYQLHLNDYDPERATEIRDTLELLVQEGLIRSYGWSTDFVERAAVFAQGAHCTAVQHQYNVLEDNPDMIAFVETHQLASINRGPLGMGLLTGKYTQGTSLSNSDIRAKTPEWLKFFSNGQPAPEYLQKLELIREVLTSDGRSLAQGALAWIWGSSGATVPIPGVRTVAQAEQNAAAMQFGALRAEQMQQVASILRDA